MYKELAETGAVLPIECRAVFEASYFEGLDIQEDETYVRGEKASIHEKGIDQKYDIH